LLNVLIAERMKLKRNRLFLVCSIICVLLPLVMIVEDIYQYRGSQPDDLIRWLFSLLLLCQIMIYPILSGLIISFIVQKEYSDQTIINTLTAPVRRFHFLFGKLIMWFIWYLTQTICFLLISCLGVYLLFGHAQLSEHLALISKMVLESGILSFLTLVPAIWIAVLQRKLFYPSILFCCVASGVGFAGLYWPYSISKIVPWSAVAILNLPNGPSLGSIPYISIFACATIGLHLAVRSFRVQEL